MEVRLGQLVVQVFLSRWVLRGAGLVGRACVLAFADLTLNRGSVVLNLSFLVRKMDIIIILLPCLGYGKV